MRSGLGMSASAECKVPEIDDGVAATSRTVIGYVLLLALLFRLTAAILVEHRVRQEGRSFFVEGDANGYWDLGRAIASGDDYAIHYPPRRVLRVPGFPLLLAAVIRMFGENIFAARCVLAIVGTGCCWLTWLLGKRLATARVGVCAALLMAVSPLQTGNSVLILSENWFAFWMLVGLLALVKLIDRPQGTANDQQRLHPRLVGQSALTGGLIAVAVLIRPGFVPWIVVAFAAALFLPRTSWSVRWATAITMVAAFGAVMLPWVIRNHSITGHWVVTSLWSGPSLYDGLNPHADGSSDMQFIDDDNVMESMSEYEMNAYYQRMAMEFVREHPGRVIVLAGRKALRFLQPAPGLELAGWGLWVVTGGASILFLIFCLAGIRSRMLGLPGLLVVLGPFFLFLMVHMVFVGSLRYRLPTEFPLAILAAAGLSRWFPVRKPG